MARLTKRTVDETRPPESGDAFLWDDELPGFFARVKASGVKTYGVQYRIPGHTRRYALGKHGVLTAEAARRRAREVLGRVAGGADPSADRRAERAAAREAAREAECPPPTVQTLAERYLQEHAATKKKASSVASDRALIRRFVSPRLGDRPVVEVTRDEIGRLHHGLQDTPYTANRLVALLSKMFNLAERWGLRPDGTNPCRHVERYREEKRERFLTYPELERLGRALVECEQDGTITPEVSAAVRLLLLTGARRGEILGLRWDFIDFERHAIRLPDSKTGRKPIPLNAPALEVLSRLPQRSSWVFPTAEGSSPVSLSKPWERIRRRAELPDLRIHDLRHSHASVAASSGASLTLIGRILGHSSPTTTARYAHLLDDPVRQLSESVGARIDAAMSGGSSAPVMELHPKGERNAG